MKKKSTRKALGMAAATPAGNPPNQLATTTAGMCSRNGPCPPRIGSQPARSTVASTAISMPMARPANGPGAMLAANHAGRRNTKPPRGRRAPSIVRRRSSALSQLLQRVSAESRCIRRHGAADALDLSEVQQIVPGVEPNEMLEALLATLRVHTHPPQVGRSRALEEPQVPLPQHDENRERLTWIALVIMQAIRPQVLIVAGQRRPIVREDEARPPRPDQLGIGEVVEDLPDRPFARTFRLAQVPRRQSVARVPQCPRRLAQHRDGIAIAEERKDGGYVGRRVLRGARCRIREH